MAREKVKPWTSALERRDSALVGDGFFAPESTIWKVDREMVLLLGGGRALLMQLAHPKVAVGVAEHSSFKEDPLGRLQRTMNAMWSIVFDEIEEARASLQRVKEVHSRVRGVFKEREILPAGTPYDALDPDLLLWVHGTLVDSALVTYESLVRRLSVEKKAQYYDETKRLARLFEIPEPKIPTSLDAFQAYMRETMESEMISIGPMAAKLAHEILHPRSWLLKPASPLFAWITVALLPQKLRDAYGLKWDERRDKNFRLFTALVRRLLPLVPALLRVVPQARAAQKRLKLG